MPGSSFPIKIKRFRLVLGEVAVGVWEGFSWVCCVGGIVVVVVRRVLHAKRGQPETRHACRTEQNRTGLGTPITRTARTAMM